MLRQFVSCICISLAHSVSAETIYLSDVAGNEYSIGEVHFDHSGHYELEVDHTAFKDFFLSMKEMKCLEGKDIWCHIPYPYDMPRTVEADDYRWLSQDLLFMYKSPGEFGANLWQGIYYQLTPAGSELHGRAMHVDLNQLASPPDDLSRPFFDEEWLEEVSTSERWLPKMIIR